MHEGGRKINRGNATLFRHRSGRCIRLWTPIWQVSTPCVPPPIAGDLRPRASRAASLAIFCPIRRMSKHTLASACCLDMPPATSFLKEPWVSNRTLRPPMGTPYALSSAGRINSSTTRTPSIAITREKDPCTGRHARRLSGRDHHLVQAASRSSNIRNISRTPGKIVLALFR